MCEWFGVGRILSEKADWLERQFEEEEIHSSILKMGGEKAPGPYGFSIALKNRWEVVKHDLMLVF